MRHKFSMLKFVFCSIIISWHFLPPELNGIVDGHHNDGVGESYYNGFHFVVLADRTDISRSISAVFESIKYR